MPFIFTTQKPEFTVQFIQENRNNTDSDYNANNNLATIVSDFRYRLDSNREQLKTLFDWIESDLIKDKSLLKFTNLTDEETFYLLSYFRESPKEIYIDEEITELDEDLEEDLYNYLNKNRNESNFFAQKAIYSEASYAPSLRSISLEDLNMIREESFSKTLLKMIDKSGMRDSECYKKANVDRRLFSKIKNDPNYSPSKETVLSFAIALELSLDETDDLLEKAGYALSNAKIFDLVIKYFITNKNYDMFTINQALYSYDQKLLNM